MTIQPRSGQRSCVITGRFVLLSLAILTLASCKPAGPARVDAADYDAYWLWAGVEPQPVLAGARTIYLLHGEVRDGARVNLDIQRGLPTGLHKSEIWLVVRTETLDWPEEIDRRLLAELDRWKQAGNNVVGLQIDFDARTRHLGRYAEFLKSLRRRLPQRYRLSITGLLDWSANGDPAGLASLAGTVDEVVMQTYQGRQTIPGYERYLKHLDRVPMRFRIGLVQGGHWREPPQLHQNRNFRGYVVFLVNPETASVTG